MNDEDLVRLAHAAGLRTYLTQFREQLLTALRSATTLAARLPRDVSPREECAHTFALPAPRDRQS